MNINENVITDEKLKELFSGEIDIHMLLSEAKKKYDQCDDDFLNDI